MELLAPINPKSKKPIYEQIYLYIREEIQTGHLREGERLPSTRTLAKHLKISRSTTQMAYEQLLAEGYIEAKPYRGNYVARLGDMIQTGSETKKITELKMEMEEPADTESSGGCIDFSPRGIDLEHFPYNIWRKLSRNTLTDDNRDFFHAGTPQGEPGLRAAILSYLHSARGVNCTQEQIIIGAGSEYLLMLLSLILGKDHNIAMENPTYKQAFRVFCSLGYKVCPVSMDESGMSPDLLALSQADIAYIMPSHQYPTGIVMPVGRRKELLHWAETAAGRYLIEDDYDSEFRYKGKPIPALQGMDQKEKVIYLGTFSKCIAPAIRVSYMVLPEHLLKRYKENAGFYASTVSRQEQYVLYQFLSQGHFERHLNRMRTIYKNKHDALLTALHPLEKKFEIRGENAGLHILLTDHTGHDEQTLIALARKAEVKVYGISEYDISPGCCPVSQTIVIGFATLPEEKIIEGVSRLKECWK